MKPDVKVLRLGDMVFNRQGVFIRRAIHAVVSIALRLFFRRIETVNASEVPYKGALIFVMNHPNGLIDPALVFVALPRKISFLAKSTLFKVPVVSYILRVIEALPVYRKIDSADVTQNAKTFEASHELLRKGGAIAIFPEGVSHNSPKLLPIKTGAARIALGALSVSQTDEEIDLKIVPVGLFYTSKTTFRSEALLHFGEPFPVKSVELEDGDLPREAVKELTEKIENSLREVTLNAETGSAINNADEAANLFLSVSETFDLEEPLSARFEFLRKYLAEKNTRQEKNLKADKVAHRISQYKKKLRLIGLEPENLSLSSQPFWYVFQDFLVRVFLLLLFSPLAIIGTILHFPAYQLSKILASHYTNHGVDDIISTVKIISGIVFMPLTWIAAAIFVYIFWGWKLALAAVPLCFFCGYVALRSLEEIEDLRGWFRAVVLLYRKRKLFVELLRERRDIYLSLKKQ
ncbi:MAG: 1-acyl-sn-glycerol-3-phosphate acyltransferase [Pyrinomonadaceae bacterium]|nr:1-acyl-sn-glycerol-3-phosphate acyltransferase [Pyrinomonadaceae bacterium]